jgi:hypothetical protein
MDTTDREAEIREIERELQILQRRYANLDAAGRQLRAGFYIMIGLLITFMIVAAIMSHLPALLLWMGVLVFALLNIWATTRLFPDLRLIDWVGWWPGRPRWGVKRSEAEAGEDMVAERMERLARLKVNYQ